MSPESLVRHNLQYLDTVRNTISSGIFVSKTRGGILNAGFNLADKSLKS